MVPDPETELAGHGPPQVSVVAVGKRLVCMIMNIFSYSSSEEGPLC
jgi:hypothetical protein